MTPLCTERAFMGAASRAFDQLIVHVAPACHSHKMILVHDVLDEVIAWVWKRLQVFDQRSRRVVDDSFSVPKRHSIYSWKRRFFRCVPDEFCERLFAFSADYDVDFWVRFQTVLGCCGEVLAARDRENFWVYFLGSFQRSGYGVSVTCSQRTRRYDIRV